MTSTNNDTLIFSPDALSNRDMFLSDLNDVNFYVEDMDKEHIYEIILKQVFKGFEIFAVFPLGGKSKVLEQCRAENESTADRSGKVNVYIVDGDFDILWADRVKSYPNLIYLRRYNIEAYYYSREAVTEYMCWVLKRQQKFVQPRIQLDAWEKMRRNDLGKLFLLFAVANRECPSKPTVGAVNEFINEDGSLNEEAYEAYYQDIKREVNNLESLIEEVRKRVDDISSDLGDDKICSIICGKAQEKSLLRHLHAQCPDVKKRITPPSLEMYLIPRLDVAPLRFLWDTVYRLLP